MRFAVLVLVLALRPAAAHDVITTKLTWSREISRIFYRNCVQCHREGGAAPMSLMKYDEARPWAVAIKEEVLNRRMPQWNAVAGFGEFKNDASLTQEEISRIADWVEGGAPEGDPVLLPAAPRFGGSSKERSPRYRQKVVGNGNLLTAAVTVVGVRAGQIAAGSSAKLAAQRPDGTFEPLLWILRNDGKVRRTYEFVSPVVLPAGTRFMVTPPTAGSFEILSK